MEPRFLAPVPKWAFSLLGLALVAALGVLDYQTGWEFSIVAAYLVPIALVAWMAGRWPGVFIAFASGVAWFLADKLSEHEYVQPSYQIWNLAMQLAMFCTVALALSALRERFEVEREAARTDELTGLPNRRAFVEMASAETERLKRYGGAVTIACLDLDGFKAVNDRDGHAVGDRLLKNVAAEIRTEIRTTDYVARVGGDEFYVLFPETWAVEADALLSRVWAGLQRFMREAGWSVTSSIGAATFEGAPESVEEMMKLADRLMYAAKKSGGDRIEKRVVVAEPPKKEWSEERRRGEVPPDASPGGQS